MKNFKEAIALGATLQANEHVQLADCLDATDRISEAIKHYRIAIDMEPTQKNWYNYLALALF